MTTPSYPKRLIEVDLPIKRISAHARREKSIRHGHISTLHIWWARRPLAACRAVICASLWPDPADPLCPERFKTEAAVVMKRFFEPGGYVKKDYSDPMTLRKALLDFIADFANWDNSTKKEYLETARALTQVAHESMGGEPGTRPLVVDPFAGGGSIPLEALRVGADAYASDLNPVAVLLNKVVLEYIPKYGQTLADEVMKWGAWVKHEAEKELAEFYPKDPDGATPIAYLWARTIQCEGPGCGAEVPLIRSLWLAKKGSRSIALEMIPDPEKGTVDFEIIEKQGGKWVQQANPNAVVVNPSLDGTVKRGSATCKFCGFTTPVASVRKQLKARHGGANDARMFCVVTTKTTEKGRFYRLPTERDLEAVRKAGEELERRKKAWKGELSLVPDEPLPPQGTLGFRVQGYGMLQWGDLFTARQLLALTTLVRLLHQIEKENENKQHNESIAAIQTSLAFQIDKLTDLNNSLVGWDSTVECPHHLFARQALPIVWDFAESYLLGDSSGSLGVLLQRFSHVLEEIGWDWHIGQYNQNTATIHPLPTNFVSAIITDPPYYDAVPYADLSDFFYVWLKRSIHPSNKYLFSSLLTPKDDECIVDEVKGKDNNYFENTMKLAMIEGRRILIPFGLSVIVFAHKSTSGWEAQLTAIIHAGWKITGSWPIDTESGNRLRARDSAALASSIHLVCRPRQTNEIGDWRDVLHELPIRIHEWMPRLKDENVVGADAIFACLGPALEIYSRYGRVEKASGEQVALKEYLEHVWAAVAREALAQIFEDPDTSGFEEDARITAMWLWTLTGKLNGVSAKNVKSVEEGTEDEVEEKKGSNRKAAVTGFTLEYDAVRKIAQGLGAHLEQLTNLVEIKGNKARLLPVSERAKYLFGKEQVKVRKKSGKKEKQVTLWGEVTEKEKDVEELGIDGFAEPGETVLDQIHQSMLLFAEGKSEALKRLLVEDGVGKDQRFWKLAQALSALYPRGTDEKRWVDGVMARKKGFGL